jgi:uncharacterized membrane protein
MSRKRRHASSSGRADVAAARASGIAAAATASPRDGGVGTGERVGAVDALRGSALLLMFVYHFAFDLRFYGVTSADFEHDFFWLSFRALIVGIFMALVGVSLVLAARAHATPRHFWRRIAIIAACALLATIASRILFPQTFIYFGILPAIAVASVLAWPLANRPRTALVVGVVVVVAGVFWSHPMFDARPLSWIGFVTEKPATEDYVPLAPWAGFVAMGIAAGHWLVRSGFRATAPLAAAPAWLRWLGRHSLFVYMVHQPILLGVLWLAVGH